MRIKKISVFLVFLILLLLPKILLSGEIERIDSQIIDLSGRWIEVDNYPDYGILLITQEGDKIEGRYERVGYNQKVYYGFEVGELVLKGTIQDNTIEGKVLLKEHKNFIKKCTNYPPTQWSGIRMKIVDEGQELHGKWKQEVKDYYSCKLIEEQWQTYNLKKIK